MVRAPGPFAAGGAGTVLNRAAVRALHSALDTRECRLSGSAEGDVRMAECLGRGRGGVRPHDTRDAAGGERFNPLSPAESLSYVPDPTHWLTSMSVGIKAGADCCSAEAVTFGTVGSAARLSSLRPLGHHLPCRAPVQCSPCSVCSQARPHARDAQGARRHVPREGVAPAAPLHR